MRSEKCDAESIAGVITETLQKWTLNIEKLRGLEFDGASVMSGANTGVQEDFEKFSHVQHMFIVDHIN